MTLLGTAAVLVGGIAVLLVVVWILTIIPGFTITAGPFPYGTTHDVFTVHGRQDVLTLFWFCSVVVLVPLTVLGGVVSWLVARRTVRPLHDVIATADGLDVDDLRARVPVAAAQDETRAVAIALNALLDRLEAGVAARSRFAANASTSSGTHSPPSVRSRSSPSARPTTRSSSGRSPGSSRPTTG